LETLNINDQQGEEICEKVSQWLIDEMDNEKIWNKVEMALENYLKNNKINQDASEIIEKLNWSVKVTLKK
jgi:hypothetical protein